MRTWSLLVMGMSLLACDGKGLDAFAGGTIMLYPRENGVELSLDPGSADCARIANRVRGTANGKPMRRLDPGCTLRTTKSGLDRSNPSWMLDDPGAPRGGKTTFLLTDGTRTVTFETWLFEEKEAVELVSPKFLEGVADGEPIRLRSKLGFGRWSDKDKCHAEVEPPEGKLDGLTRTLECRAVSPTELEVRALAKDDPGLATSKLPGCKLVVTGNIATDDRCEGVKTCHSNGWFKVTLPARFK